MFIVYVEIGIDKVHAVHTQACARAFTPHDRRDKRMTPKWLDANGN